MYGANASGLESLFVRCSSPGAQETTDSGSPRLAWDGPSRIPGCPRGRDGKADTRSGDASSFPGKHQGPLAWKLDGSIATNGAFSSVGNEGAALPSNESPLASVRGSQRPRPFKITWAFHLHPLRCFSNCLAGAGTVVSRQQQEARYEVVPSCIFAQAAIRQEKLRRIRQGWSGTIAGVHPPCCFSTLFVDNDDRETIGSIWVLIHGDGEADSHFQGSP